MLKVISLGDYYAPINDRDGFPELRAEVNAVCGERFRRIDRFIQLCLLGAARCAAGTCLDGKTGLYIGSRFAAICNTIKVQEQMFIHGQIPKPANFINTLSNSAGYYVARNLNVQGKNIFVSRANASLEAVLELARLDLQNGTIEQALIGVVDEGAPVQAHHCQRMGIAEDTALGEGSHWFLLRRHSKTNGVENENALATITDVQVLPDESSLRVWLDRQVAQHANTFIYNDPLKPAVFNSAAFNIAEWGLPLYEPTLDYYPSRTGGALIRFIQEKKKAALITLCTDEAGRTHVTHTVV